MNQAYNRQKNRLIILILLSLFLFISSVAYFVYETNQRFMMKQVSNKMEVELNILNEYIKDFLIRNDYAEAKNFLEKWVANENGIVQLTVVFPNNTELFSYRKSESTHNCQFANKILSLDGEEITITIGHNIQQIYEDLDDLKIILACFTFILTGVLAVALWLILSRWILGPIQGEIARQTKIIREYSEDLEVINFSYKALSSSNIALASSENEEELLKKVCDIIHIDCGYKLVWIGYCDESGTKDIIVKASTGDSQEYIDTIDLSWDKGKTAGSGPAGRCINSREPVVIDSIANDSQFNPWKDRALNYSLRSVASFPIIYKEKMIGVLTVYGDREKIFLDKEIALLKELCQNLGFGVFALRDRKEVRRLSALDNLTGLFNRHKINQLFEHEITRSARYKNDLSLIITDIDHFKDVNDTYGHNVGDKILQEFSLLLQDERRKTDYVGRWGGEEFIIILPDIDLKQAICLAKKLQKQISQFDFTEIGKKTASFGVATFREGDTPESFVDRADKALYVAKERGRNCVMDETVLKKN